MAAPPPGERRVVGPGFHAQVFAVVRQVPHGKVATYGQIATLLGSPRVARHVGFALAGAWRVQGDDPVPWHRIVNAKGSISTREDADPDYDQRSLLEREGVGFRANGTVDLRAFRWSSGLPPGTGEPVTAKQHGQRRKR